MILGIVDIDTSHTKSWIRDISINTKQRAFIETREFEYPNRMCTVEFAELERQLL